MRRLAILLLTLLCAATALAQSTSYTNRKDALAGLGSPSEEMRAQAVVWIAEHGTFADSDALRQRLTDDSDVVRGIAEQGLWMLWSRSGDERVDALMAKGSLQMQADDFKGAIATFSEVIRRKPAFAEGWNKRATVLFLAGDYKRSLADCDEVMKRNPYHFGALAGYGQIHFELKHYEKAIHYWKRALEVNPNMVGVEISIKGTERLLVEQRKHSA